MAASCRQRSHPIFHLDLNVKGGRALNNGKKKKLNGEPIYKWIFNTKQARFRKSSVKFFFPRTAWYINYSSVHPGISVSDTMFFQSTVTLLSHDVVSPQTSSPRTLWGRLMSHRDAVSPVQNALFLKLICRDLQVLAHRNESRD